MEIHCQNKQLATLFQTSESGNNVYFPQSNQFRVLTSVNETTPYRIVVLGERVTIQNPFFPLLFNLKVEAVYNAHRFINLNNKKSLSWCKTNIPFRLSKTQTSIDKFKAWSGLDDWNLSLSTLLRYHRYRDIYIKNPEIVPTMMEDEKMIIELHNNKSINLELYMETKRQMLQKLGYDKQYNQQLWLIGLDTLPRYRRFLGVQRCELSDPCPNLVLFENELMRGEFASIVILVDRENVSPKDVQALNKKHRIISYATSDSRIKKLANEELRIITNRGKNTADFVLLVEAQRLLSKTNAKVILFSKDHYGENIVHPNFLSTDSIARINQWAQTTTYKPQLYFQRYKYNYYLLTEGVLTFKYLYPGSTWKLMDGTEEITKRSDIWKALQNITTVIIMSSEEMDFVRSLPIVIPKLDVRCKMVIERLSVHEMLLHETCTVKDVTVNVLIASKNCTLQHCTIRTLKCNGTFTYQTTSFEHLDVNYLPELSENIKRTIHSLRYQGNQINLSGQYLERHTLVINSPFLQLTGQFPSLISLDLTCDTYVDLNDCLDGLEKNNMETISLDFPTPPYMAFNKALFKGCESLHFSERMATF